MGPCSLFWVCAIICMIALKPYVYCGPCTRNEDCVGTDYTLLTCETSTKQCTCNTDYGPIRTGCGLKLTKPTVNIEGERGPYLFTGTTGNLSCSTTPGAVSYNWYQGGSKVGSSQTLTISAAGSYTCQAISNTETLNSDASQPLAVNLIGVSPAAYTGALEVAFQPSGSTIFTGKSVTLSCKGVPMGYTDTIDFLDGTGAILVTSTAPSLSATYAITVSKSGLACKLKDVNKVSFTQSVNSLTLPTPANSNPLTAATISAKDSTGDISAATTYSVGAVGPTLTCITAPLPEFLDITASKSILYEFKDGANSLQSSNSNTYTVTTTTPSIRSYSCTATYDSVSQTGTLGFAITVATGFILDPVLTKVSTTDLTIGSTLVLSCGATKDSTTSYIWLINDIIIAGQIDWKIQLYNFTEADIALYKCRAVKSRYMTALSSFPAIMKPTVTRVTSGTIYGEGGDYVLKCNTGSIVTVGWTYLWKKGATDTLIKTDTYTITNATGATHNGTYSCISTYNGASGTSDPITVAVVAPGKRCTGDTECTGTGFSGKCITTTDPKVCECSANYILKGETCASGAAALISCVLMVVMASLGSVFF